MTARYRMPDNVGYAVVDGDTEEAPPSACLAALPTGPIHWLDATGPPHLFRSRRPSRPGRGRCRGRRTRGRNPAGSGPMWWRS